jgi:rare lipoprotein A
MMSVQSSFRFFVMVCVALLVLTGCSSKKRYGFGGGSFSSVGKKASKFTMRPYTVLGKTYYPKKAAIGEKFRGIASWYGPNFHGKLTSNGERYNMHGMTAAHKTLPMNTILKVKNLDNRREVVLRVNDRGPFVDNRIIDLSKEAAKRLGVLKHGTTRVELTVLGYNRSIPYNLNKLANQSKRDESKIIRRVPQETTVIVDRPAQKKQSVYEPSVVASPPAPTLPSSSGIYVQIGAFSSLEKAQDIQLKFDAENPDYNARIKSDASRGIHKIIVGAFDSDAQAKAFINNSEYSGAYIIRN